MSELLVEFLLITLAFGWTLIDRQGGNATQDPILGRLGLALSTGSAWATRLSFIGTVAAVQVHCLPPSALLSYPWPTPPVSGARRRGGSACVLNGHRNTWQ